MGIITLMSYSLWLFIFIWMPILILWRRNFPLLWKYRKLYLFAILFTFIFSIPWDVLAVRNHIWYFPPEGNLKIYLGELPIEEYLFMASVTFLIATVTTVVKYKN